MPTSRTGTVNGFRVNSSDAIDYWVDKLTGAPAMLELPTDRPLTLGAKLPWRSAVVCCPTALSESLESFSRSEGVTLYTPMMTRAANAVLSLHRPVGLPDLLADREPKSSRNGKADRLFYEHFRAAR